ncbi:MAG TPA: hypothetical protein VM616_07010 [Gammaproteobacteria bacterium]|nr:hypothetical protein [Gammaproteobacteria bacterium]
MDLTPAYTAAERIEEGQPALDPSTRKVIHMSAVRLRNIARQMLVERELPRECVRLIFAGIAEDLRT